jgi:hypothetical protein
MDSFPLAGPDNPVETNAVAGRMIRPWRNGFGSGSSGVAMSRIATTSPD